MRNRALHDALREFALEAAAHLTHELSDGGEIPFDVVEEPGGRTVLYNYRPLTSEFIGQRWSDLRSLPACGPAADALGSGAENYLRMQSTAAAADSEPALAAMLERIYEDATSFEFPEERFERVYAEVERALFQNTLRTAIVAPLHGLEMEHDSVDLGDGLFLIAGDKLDAPPGAVWSDPTGHVEHGREPNVLCVLRRDVGADAPLPVGEARIRFRKLLTALRLFKPGGVSFGPLAWARVDEGTWQPTPLGASGPGSSKRRRPPSSSSSWSWSRPPPRGAGSRGPCRASRWAATARSTPRRCPTTCSPLSRCSTLATSLAAPPSHCGWPRCAPKRASGARCSAARSSRSHSSGG
jgi:hypothetical protein